MCKNTMCVVEVSKIVMDIQKSTTYTFVSLKCDPRVE